MTRISVTHTHASITKNFFKRLPASLSFSRLVSLPVSSFALSFSLSLPQSLSLSTFHFSPGFLLIIAFSTPDFLYLFLSLTFLFHFLSPWLRSLCMTFSFSLPPSLSFSYFLSFFLSFCLSLLSISVSLLVSALCL